MIERKSMKHHTNNECSMTKLQCDECKSDVLRKNMKNHTENECTEREIVCQFAEYGCNIKIKRRLMSAHLIEQEVNQIILKKFLKI